MASKEAIEAGMRALFNLKHGSGAFNDEWRIRANLYKIEWPTPTLQPCYDKAEAALTAAAAIDGDWNAGVEAAAELAEQHAKGYAAYRDHFPFRDALIAFAAEIRKLKR